MILGLNTYPKMHANMPKKAVLRLRMSLWIWELKKWRAARISEK
jgi:hypothetical protein